MWQCSSGVRRTSRYPSWQTRPFRKLILQGRVCILIDRECPWEAGFSGSGIRSLLRPYSGNHCCRGAWNTTEPCGGQRGLRGTLRNFVAIRRKIQRGGTLPPMQTNLRRRCSNPFQTPTTIMYTLRQDTHVTPALVSLLCQRVVLLVKGFQSAGIKREVSTGTYARVRGSR